ncbi:MAG: hypothetical protein IJH71_08940 [Eubacterium sp.]|nr:hypothetical protein [Eubacterium sp.]
MIFGLTYYMLIWFFLIYAMIGWGVEVVYQAVKKGIIVNRGFLNGPVCPVYGFGMCSILLAIGAVSGGKELNLFILFLVGTALTTTIELVAGRILDLAFHARWWDYSDMPFNLNGYICLEFSIIWGLGCVFVIKLVHPLIEHLTADTIPAQYGMPFLGMVYATLLADCIITVATVRGLNKKLREIDELSAIMRMPSDAVSRSLAENAINASVKLGETQVQAALARAEMRDAYENTRKEIALQQTRNRQEIEQRLKELTDSLLNHRVFGAGRFIFAFPHMTHRDFQASIEKIKNTAMERKNFVRLFTTESKKEETKS